MYDSKVKMSVDSEFYNGEWYCQCGKKGKIEEEFHEHITDHESETHRMISGREHQAWVSNKQLQEEVQELREKLADSNLLETAAKEINTVLSKQLLDCQAENNKLRTELRKFNSNFILDSIGNEHSRIDTNPETRTENGGTNGSRERRLNRRRGNNP